MSQSVKTKHPVDVHVGKKLRQMRWLRGLTQQELGLIVSIKFQQIQKYETGMNRISASRLFEFAEALGIPVDYFYSGLKPVRRIPNSEIDSEIERGNDLSIHQIRADVRRVYPDIQDRLAYMVQMVLDERARFAALPIPNEPEALDRYRREDEFLRAMQAGLISIHEDLPPLDSDEISESDAKTIKSQLLKLAHLTNETVKYLDSDDGTYGGLYKMGLISGIAGLLSVIPGVNFVAGATLSSLIFGAQAVKVKISDSKS